MKYSDLLLDHFHNPRNVGSFALHETQIYTGKAGDYTQGDIVQLQMQCRDTIIVATRFKAYGAVPTLAISSYVSEWLIGKTLAEAPNLTSESLMTLLKLPRVKLYCALLVEDALNTVLKGLSF